MRSPSGCWVQWCHQHDIAVRVICQREVSGPTLGAEAFSASPLFRYLPQLTATGEL
jgi:hypothetical protein